MSHALIPKDLKSNQYWGRRSGTLVEDGPNYFKQSQWGTGSSNGQAKKRGVLSGRGPEGGTVHHSKRRSKSI